MNLFIHLLFATFLQEYLTELISSSKLVKCYKTSNNASEISCKNKIVVSLSLENNQLQTDEINLNISSLESENPQQSYVLKEPIQISLTKSNVLVLYPLIYLQDFNYQPKESVLQTGFLGCSDSFNQDASCGRAYDGQGTPIIDSQGFCCSCSFLTQIGFGSDDIERGKSCRAFNFGKDSTTAHCLYFDQLWYSGYVIDSHQIKYSITIQVNKPGNMTESLNIGSGQTDFHPLNEIPNLQQLLVLRPSRPITHPIVQQGFSRWMIINKIKVTQDGRECDKIGVSYSAFKNQNNECERLVGTCLKNQIKDLLDSDLEKLSKGKKPQYLLYAQGQYQAGFNQNNELYLIYNYQWNFATLITLEIVADDIQYITNLGKGSIDFAEINNFESMTGDGILVYQISNIGELVSEYQIDINCTQQIVSINSQKLYIQPMSSQKCSQSIRTTQNISQNHSCIIQLKNNIGDYLDQKLVSFNTTYTQEISYNQQSLVNGSNQTTGKDQEVQIINQIENCVKQCFKLDMICKIIYGNCAQDIVIYYITFLLSLLLLGVIPVSFCYCGSKIFSCCKTSKSQKYKSHYYPDQSQLQHSFSGALPVIEPRNFKRDNILYTSYISNNNNQSEIQISKSNKFNDKSIQMLQLYLNVNQGDSILQNSVGFSVKVLVTIKKVDGLPIPYKIVNLSLTHQMSTAQKVGILLDIPLEIAEEYLEDVSAVTQLKTRTLTNQPTESMIL